MAAAATGTSGGKIVLWGFGAACRPGSEGSTFATGDSAAACGGAKEKGEAGACAGAAMEGIAGKLNAGAGAAIGAGATIGAGAAA